jgi:hypothetical protein
VVTLGETPRSTRFEQAPVEGCARILVAHRDGFMADHVILFAPGQAAKSISKMSDRPPTFAALFDMMTQGALYARSI